MRLEFPQPPILLDKPAPKISVLIGTESNQIRFMIKKFLATYPQGQVIRDGELSDETLLSVKTPTLWIIDDHRMVDGIAEDTWSKIPAYSATPLVKRSASVNAIVKYASKILDQRDELTKAEIGEIGDRILGPQFSGDIDTLVVDAMDLILSRPTREIKNDERCEPWVDPLKWIIPGEPLYYRLSRLYKVSVGYVFAKMDDWANAKKLGISPAQYAWLKTLRLNDRLVEETIVQLSRWKNHQASPETTAFLIVAIWSK